MIIMIVVGGDDNDDCGGGDDNDECGGGDDNDDCGWW